MADLSAAAIGAGRVRSPIADIGPQFDCVLAWDLGDDLTAADLEATQRWAEQVHAADRRVNRPLICRPRTDLRGFSRPANMLLIDRRPLGTSLAIDKYATWVRQQPLLASLGTPVWTTVQTQPNEALRQQLTLLEPGYAPPLTVSPEQIRLLAYIGGRLGQPRLGVRVRYAVGHSRPRHAAAGVTLKLINSEMQRLEPWAAAGSSSPRSNRSDRRRSAATVLQTDPRECCCLVAFARCAVRAVAVGGQRRDAAGDRRARGLRRL